jgi:DNA-binding transcriptional MerR regulator
MNSSATSTGGLTVAGLVREPGVSGDTVRYYERVGLLAAPARTAAGYRLYSPEAIDRLWFIQGAQRLGLRLREIRDLLAGPRDRHLPVRTARGDAARPHQRDRHRARPAFFAELGPERAENVEAASTDMGQAFPASIAKPGHAPAAALAIDLFHAVKLVTDALDQVRRGVWNELGNQPDKAAAKKFKGARWALLERPEALSEDQAALALVMLNFGPITLQLPRERSP